MSTSRNARDIAVTHPRISAAEIQRLADRLDAAERDAQAATDRLQETPVDVDAALSLIRALEQCALLAPDLPLDAAGRHAAQQLADRASELELVLAAPRPGQVLADAVTRVLQERERQLAGRDRARTTLDRERAGRDDR